MINNSLITSNKKQQCDDNMIPMINIVFLLLIFFMIAGHLRIIQDQGIDLPVSSLGKPAIEETITIQLSHENELYLQGDKISVEQLASELAALMAGNTVLSLQVDRRVQAIELDKTLDIIRATGIFKVTLHAQAALGA